MTRGKHESAGPHLNRAIKWLENQAIVKKVILGIFTGSGHKFSPGTIRCKSITKAGINATGYDDGGVVRLFIVVESQNIETVKKIIEDRFK